MNEGFKAVTAQELIKMYNLDALVTERKQTKARNEEIKKVSTLVKDFAETINNEIKDLEDQVDGKISTWFFSGIPTSETEPEVNWTTDEEREKHIGDIYYDQDKGNSYTYMFKDDLYQWVESAAGDVAEVLAIANKAQDTADRKRQIFVVQPYPPYEVGDMWIKDDKDIYRCRAKRIGGEFSETDWVLASDYTNDDYAKDVEAQLNIFKEIVSTDYVLKTTLETSNEGIRSEVSSLTTIVEQVNVNVQELNDTVEVFSVEMAQNTLVIPTDNNNNPIASKVYEIPFYGYFKGKQVIPNITISGNNSGITASKTSTAIKFEVQSNTSIAQLSNSYEITYSYYYDGYNYITTKNVTITLAPKGSDGTSVNILGSYDSYAELKKAHPTGNVGDAYIVQGNMYVWNTEEQDWVDVGDIQGHGQTDGGTQSFGAEQIGTGDEEHKNPGNKSDEHGLFQWTQVNCRRDQGADGDDLVRPGEVVPQHIEALGIFVWPPEKQWHKHDHRQADEKTVAQRLLVDLDFFRKTQTAAPQSGISWGNGKDNDTDNGDTAHPAAQEVVDDPAQRHRGGKFHGFGEEVENRQGRRCPDHSDEAFKDHHTVETAFGLPFAPHSTGDNGGLSGVESWNDTAGNGDEKHRKNGLFEHSRLESGAFGKNGRVLDSCDHQFDKDGTCADEEQRTENGVAVADDLVHRKHSCDNVVNKDCTHGYPEKSVEHRVKTCGIWNQVVNKVWGDVDENRHHKQQADQHKNWEAVADNFTAVVLNEFGEIGAVFA